MAYLHCGRCGLEIKIHAAYLQFKNCPRCLARSATLAPMTLISGPVTHAAGWGPPPSEDVSDLLTPGEQLIGATRRRGRPR